MQRAWLSIAFALAVSGDLGAFGGPSFDAVAAPASHAEASARTPRYDELVQRSVHNAYARTEPLVDQLAWHGVRSLELDIHTSKKGVMAPAGDFFVYHADLPFTRESSCATLDACLAQVRAFHEVVPSHDVVTLFIDLKDAPTGAHDARALDDALTRGLGEDALVTPAELAAACGRGRSLREAVSGDCRFPFVKDLRSKVLVVVTGGTTCNRQSGVSLYAGDDGMARAAFVAPDANEDCPVEALDAPRAAHVAFVNLSLSEVSRARAVRARGLVARVYGGGVLGGLDSPSELAEARHHGAQILATDAVNAQYDPWTLEGVTLPEPKREGLLTIGAIGAGMPPSTALEWAREAEGETVLDALASVPSSHADPGSRACLVARATDDAFAAGVALCRPFASRGARLEVRDAPGAPPRIVDGNGIPASAAFIRLRLGRLDRHRTRVVAQASTDRLTWLTVGDVTVDAELGRRGLDTLAADARSAPRAVFALGGGASPLEVLSAGASRGGAR